MNLVRFPAQEYSKLQASELSASTHLQQTQDLLAASKKKVAKHAHESQTDRELGSQRMRDSGSAPDSILSESQRSENQGVGLSES